MVRLRDIMWESRLRQFLIAMVLSCILEPAQGDEQNALKEIISITFHRQDSYACSFCLASSA